MFLLCVGITPPSMRELYKLANRSKGHGAYDRSRYGRTEQNSPREPVGEEAPATIAQMLG